MIVQGEDYKKQLASIVMVEERKGYFEEKTRYEITQRMSEGNKHC